MRGGENVRFSRLGEKRSLYLYIFHPILILFFGVVNNHLLPPAWTEAYAYAGPFVVIVATLLATWALRRLHVLR